MLRHYTEGQYRVGLAEYRVAEHRGTASCGWSVGTNYRFGELQADQVDAYIAAIYAFHVEARSAKLRVVATNGRKGLFAFASIAKDEILIDLNGEEHLVITH